MGEIFKKKRKGKKNYRKKSTERSQGERLEINLEEKEVLGEKKRGDPESL